MRASIRDDGIMEAKSFEHVIEKNLCYSHSINGFRARSKDYSLRKPVVYYDHNRVVPVGEGKISDKIDRQLLEG